MIFLLEIKCFFQKSILNVPEIHDKVPELGTELVPASDSDGGLANS